MYICLSEHATQHPLRFRFLVLPCLAMCFGIAVGFFLPCSADPQTAHPDPADVDSGKVLPLDLKPGCWQVRIEARSWVAPVPQEMTPEEIAQFEKTMPPEQLDEFKSVLKELHQGRLKIGNGIGADGQKIPGVPAGGQQMACTSAPFAVNGVEVYGSKTQSCQRSIETSGGVLSMNVFCPGSDGKPQLLLDYRRISDNYFVGTRVGIYQAWPTVMSFAGKWMSEPAIHTPLSPPPTDLDARVPTGPVQVATVDGYRVVAMAEGKQIIAAVAMKMLKAQSARMLKDYGPDPWNQFQQVYLHWSVANEAMGMMLGIQEPWKSQLAAAGLRNVTPQVFRHSNGMWLNPFAESNGNVDADTVKLEDARERILWEAYFSSAKTDAEKQEMLRLGEEKYRVTLVDADFFKSPASP